MIDASAHDPKGIPPARGAEWVHHNLPMRHRTPLNVGTNPEAGIKAYVNHGRWIVDCPDCCNAQLACRTDHRFMCNECGNVAGGSLWRPVEWPGNIAAIESMLENRPRENQNWVPGETAEILAIDNLTYGGRIR